MKCKDITGGGITAVYISGKWFFMNTRVQKLKKLLNSQREPLVEVSGVNDKKLNDILK